jgi:hypothetical protein
MTLPAITVAIIMNYYLKYTFEILKNIRIQLLIGVFSFFIIALLLSTFEGQIYLLLWILVGGFTLYFIRLTFPDVWNYTFWLMGIFFINFLAMLCLIQTKFTTHPLFLMLGIILELVTLAIAFLLILHIKAIRDDISGVTERPMGHELDHEAAYVPLGLWAMAVFLFWFMSNMSVLYWYNWTVGSWGSEAYLASDVLLLLILVYILWHPQMNFDWGVEPVLLPIRPSEMRKASGLKQAKSFLPSIRKIVRVMPSTKQICPICGAKTVTEHRSCSNCGQKRIFTWCKISEGYIVTCPHCKAQTSYNKERCIHCGKPIDRYVRCTCGTRYEINDWNYLKTLS